MSGAEISSTVVATQADVGPSREIRRRAGMRREPVRVIVYAWGKAYVDRLLNRAVASLLAPGNLPALVKFYDCTLVVVTEEKQFEYVDSHPLIQHVKSLCRVRLISLDDLIGEPWQYGISLAYALFRGFADLGEAMTKTYLLFLNADFVLADGCYERLIPHMKRGESVLLSPSYCVVEEEVERLLEEIRRVGGGVLAIPARRMARMIIDHRHNTIRAKTINQRSIHFEYMDQAYWQVDEDTLVGHQMPICMIAMRPETMLAEINTFWDWGITYEFCPSRKLTVLEDSDEFLILELRSEKTHLDLLRLGPATADAAAARMSVYLTQYQLDNARFPLTLHAGALPGDLDGPRSELRVFLHEVLRRLPAHLPNHRNHPQWIYHNWHLSRHMAATRLRTEIAALRAERKKDRATTANMRNGALLMLAATMAPRFAAARDQLSHGGDGRSTAPPIAQRDEASETLAAIANEFATEAEVLQRFFQSFAGHSGVSYRERSEALRRELRILRESRVLTWDDLGYIGVPEAGLEASGRARSRLHPWSRARISDFLRRMYIWAFGSVPNTRPWHPLHFICKDIGKSLDAAALAGAQLLVVSGQHGIAASWADPTRRQHLRISPSAILNGAFSAIAPSVRFGFCLVELDRETIAKIREIHRVLTSRVESSGGILICWINGACESNETLQPGFAECALLLKEGARLRFFSSASGWGGLRLAKARQEESRFRRWGGLGAGLLGSFLQVGRRRLVESQRPLRNCWGAIVEIGNCDGTGVSSQSVPPTTARGRLATSATAATAR